jgi:hypothetical protein
VSPFKKNLSLNIIDLFGGIGIVGLCCYIAWDMKQNKKKLRVGVEHGSAVWGTQKDIVIVRKSVDIKNFYFCKIF